ncbi:MULTISPECIES: S9 family peptidase [unclassified Agrococcus]|uniref:S9 family peptidase n=1 Tax=unclassified Agrococcus TaxID=2615065 RepID=UPI00361E0E5C
MSRTPTLDDLGAFVEPGSPVLSPDGARVVSVVSRVGASGAATSQLHVRTIEGGEDARLTTGDVDADPAVSPDGATVAFVRKDGGDPGIHLVPLAGGEATRLTSGLRVAGAPAFSPDGTMLAFVALVDDAEATPPAPLVFDGDPDHKVDGLGSVATARMHVHVVRVADGHVERLTVEGHCTDPAWSPDGATIAFAQSGVEVDGHPLARRVGLVDVAAPRSSVRLPFAANAVGGPLAWMPDGAAVVAIGDLATRVGHGRLVRLDVADGSATILAEGLDRNVMGGGPGYPGGAPAFDADGRLVFCVRDGGQTVVHSLDADGGDLRRHDAGEGVVVSGLSVAGTRAVVRVSDPAVTAELALLDLRASDGAGDAVRRLTDHLGDALPDVAFVRTRPVSFAIADGTTVHGWLLRAPETDAPAPTLLDIHGGPHNAWTGAADAAHLYHQLLAARGWNVLTLNPRGSDGYGEAFLTAAVGGWGELDQQDFLEPLDRLVADGVADPERLAVTGYSYGGFMTAWLTTVTDRFRAAVPGGLVCDQRTQGASSDLGGLLRDLEIGGAANAARLSPSTYADRVTTPSLILHGADDQRCPVAQAELWHALLREHGVESRLVLYPGGSHLFILNGPLAHRRDYCERVVDWVERHAAAR